MCTIRTRLLYSMVKLFLFFFHVKLPVFSRKLLLLFFAFSANRPLRLYATTSCQHVHNVIRIERSACSITTIEIIHTRHVS